MMKLGSLNRGYLANFDSKESCTDLSIERGIKECNIYDLFRSNGTHC